MAATREEIAQHLQWLERVEGAPRELLAHARRVWEQVRLLTRAGADVPAACVVGGDGEPWAVDYLWIGPGEPGRRPLLNADIYPDGLCEWFWADAETGDERLLWSADQEAGGELPADLSEYFRRVRT